MKSSELTEFYYITYLGYKRLNTVSNNLNRYNGTLFKYRVVLKQIGTYIITRNNKILSLI